MKKKKTLIVLSIVCLSLILLGVVFSLVFKLKTVDVEIRSRLVQNETLLGENIQEKVLKDGKFDYNKNVVFMNLNKNVENIEKENAFVKVEQVIRYFPNTVRVCISERIPRFRVRDTKVEDRWYILDEEFKVLDIVDNEEIELGITKYNGNTVVYFNKTIEISPSSFTITASVGEFVNGEVLKDYFNAITSGIVGYAKDISIVKSVKIIGSIDDAKNNTGDFKFEILMKNGTDDGGVILIDGADDLVTRTYHGVHCYIAEIKNDTTIDATTAKVKVDKNANVWVESEKGNYKYSEV